jgi:hypothetical protein
VFISYAEGVKAYRILDPVTRHVHTAWDVIFDEGCGWDWSKETNDSMTTSSIEFTVDYAELEGSRGVGDSPSASSSPASAPKMPSPSPDSTPLAAPTTSLEHGGSRAPVFASSLEGDKDHIDVVHNDTLLRYRTVDDILGDQTVMPGSVQHNIDAELHLTHTGEPCSLVEAKGDAAWRAAMQQEMNSIEHNRTWELIDLPAGHRSIALKWVFKLKKNEAGEVVKHKARLVARSFIQQEGIDYDDTFAPVAHIESIRILLALAAQEGWRVHHMDVKSAFLNGNLKEEVYVWQPSGFIVSGQEGKVLQLRKALCCRSGPGTPSWIARSRKWTSSRVCTMRRCISGSKDTLSY